MPQEAGVARVWPLLCTGVAVEVLGLVGILPARPDIVHAVALPPLDLTYDVGVILARASGPWWFALGLVLAVVARATILSLMLGSLRRWSFALRFELIVLVPALVSAQLAYFGQAVLYSAVFWVGVLIAASLAVVFSHVAWSGSRSVLSTAGRGLLIGMRLPVVVSYLALLGVLGALVRSGGRTLPLIGVGASALVTVAAAKRLSRPPLAPVASRMAGVVFVALVVALSLGSSVQHVSGRAPRSTAPRLRGELVLVAGVDTSSGHGSLFSLSPSSLGFTCARTVYFSYAGTGHGAPRGQAKCPITTGSHYRRTDTERPLYELVRSFRAQVDHLAPPVTVVTHSSGAWIAWAAVSNDPFSPVRRIVMMAPLDDPLGYPPPGSSGQGAVGASGMRLISALAREEGFSEFEPDRPLATELLGPANAVQSLFARRLPEGVRALSVPSAYDVALFASSEPFGSAEEGCAVPTSHGALPTSSQALSEGRSFLEARDPPPCPPWPSWLARAAASFQVP